MLFWLHKVFQSQSSPNVDRFRVHCPLKLDETEPEVNCGDSTIGGKRKIDSNDDAVWRLVKSEKHKTTPRPGIEPGPPG